MPGYSPQVDALAYFRDWLEPSIALTDDATVQEVLRYFGDHPLRWDCNQDYFVSGKKGDVFHVWQENQGNFVCYVALGQERSRNPEVFLDAGRMDLVADFRCDPSEVLPNGHMSVGRFRDFLWHALAHCIAFREEGEPFESLAPGVSTRGLPAGAKVIDRWARQSIAPPGERMPWLGSYASADTLVLRHWGAAFRTPDARAAFEELLTSS